MLFSGEMFPYHYGSYATILTAQVSVSDILGFHTTMVLTQRNSRTEEDQGVGVSIPLWFLRNRKYVLQRILDIVGFHTTMVLTQPKNVVTEIGRAHV